ncbi:MAG: Fic family protein [Candidatus Delongbacteria bacterium]|jgi:Fic family protein|nr:Fic family protein [Candidatus Delongbacteria bacterium]
MHSIRESEIIDYIKKQGTCSSKEIFDDLDLDISYATLKRTLSKLTSNNYIITRGKGKGTKYLISPVYGLIQPVDLDQYYEKEIDERSIKKNFNFQIITDVLWNHNVITTYELAKIEKLNRILSSIVAQLSATEYKKELKRFAIDLSWKSSQIEGNTYSLLETEKLLNEKETASGKTKEEAVMLLNHKEALDFIVKNPDYLSPLSISKIKGIHSILVKELQIDRNIRKRRIGISGTNYKPLDNKFQLTEALANACDVINKKENVFEKSLLALVLISYIQPFADGNKRTARMVSNAILVNENHCPLSFRTVDSIDYKKAILLFYEQNNMSSFKDIFINQFEFAVKSYF